MPFNTSLIKHSRLHFVPFTLLLATTAITGCSDSSSDSPLSSDPTNKATLTTTSSENSSDSHQSNSSLSNSSSFNSEAASQERLLLDHRPCDGFSAAVSDTVHNTYTIDAPSGDCFGVVADGAQKRELPLYVEPSTLFNTALEVGPTAKIYNSYEQGQSRWSSVTINVTNTSDSPICFINPDGELLSLYDQNDQEVALISVDNYLDGALFPLRIERNSNTCLAAGQTLPYSSESLALPVDMVNAATYAIMPALRGSPQLLASAKPSPSLTNFSTSQDAITAEFVNTTGKAINLSFNKIIYYTADGYAVDFSFLDRQDSQSDIVESGDLFILEDDYYPISWSRPAHAERAIIYLDWDSANQQ